MSLDSKIVEKIRADFPILKECHNGKPLVYLDNAATSQKPRSVLEAVRGFYEHKNSNVHRGLHFLAERADSAYLEARRKVQVFVNAEYLQEIIFTRNATEGLNLVVQAYGRKFLQKGDEVILTKMEHHSNIVPWQMLAGEKGIKLHFVDIDGDGRLKLTDYDRFLSKKTKIVSVTHVSNVLGVLNPVTAIIEKAHQAGAKVVLDACQSAPHFCLDVQRLKCDFMAFSGHKMCAPMGVGVFYGKREFLEEMDSFLGGGGMIRKVTENDFEMADLPEKYEAGTPNVSDAVGLAAAIDYLNVIGMWNIYEYDMDLLEFLMSKIQELDFVKVFCPGDCKDRLALISFVMKGVHAHDVSEFLNNEAICVRAGHHCAQPLMERLKVPATVRASLYFYNTREEIGALISALKKCHEFFS